MEKRTLRTTPVLQSYLSEWPGVTQVFQLHRVRQLRDKVEEETVYGISSLPVGVADARRFQELVRGFGLGPALDLDPCGLGFDPRICPLCSAQNGAIPGVMWFCPHHAGSIFFLPADGTFHD